MFCINGEVWFIVFVDANDPVLFMPDGEMAVGVCIDQDKTIYISDWLYGTDFEKVLCHELVHAAMFAYNIELDEREEELFAEIIATFGEEIIDLTDALYDKARKGRL